jgi:basic amino acid/polyamine antiporter, APA family
MSANTPSLLRRLRRRDLLAMTFNNIIGSGIFTLPAVLAASAGTWSFGVLGFTALLVVLMALCSAEVASRFDRTGGPVIYADAAFGPTAGFLVGSLMYLSRLATFGAIAVIMLDYSAGLWPALGSQSGRTLAITLFIATLTAINVRGVVWGMFASNMLTLVKITPLVLLAVAGLTLAGDAWAVVPQPDFNMLGGAALLAFYACMGFEPSTLVAGEARNPRRDVPLGMIGGVLGASTLYAVLLWTCFRAVPDLTHAQRPLADAAASLAGSMGATLMLLTAVASTGGTLTLWMMTTPRLIYALASQGDLPGVLGRISATHRTPWVAIVGSAFVVWMLTISGTFVYLATFSAITRLLTYASTCGALIVLRQKDGPAPHPIPMGPLCSVIALLSTLAALLTTTGTAVRDSLIAVSVAWILRTAWRRRSRPAVVVTD